MVVRSFFLCSPYCPKQPRTSFPFYKFFYPIVSAKVSGFATLAYFLQILTREMSTLTFCIYAACKVVCVVLSKLAELAKFPEHHIYPNDISAIKKVYFFFGFSKILRKMHF